MNRSRRNWRSSAPNWRSAHGNCSPIRVGWRHPFEPRLRRRWDRSKCSLSFARRSLSPPRHSLCSSSHSTERAPGALPRDAASREAGVRDRRRVLVAGAGPQNPQRSRPGRREVVRHTALRRRRGTTSGDLAASIQPRTPSGARTLPQSPRSFSRRAYSPDCDIGESTARALPRTGSGEPAARLSGRPDESARSGYRAPGVGPAASRRQKRRRQGPGGPLLTSPARSGSYPATL
jgi:hypothetical protein